MLSQEIAVLKKILPQRKMLFPRKYSLKEKCCSVGNNASKKCYFGGNNASFENPVLEEIMPHRKMLFLRKYCLIGKCCSGGRPSNRINYRKMD